MGKKMFYQIYRAMLVSITMLTLLSLTPRGGVHDAKAQEGPVMPPNDERSLPKSITLQREASPLALAASLPMSNTPGYYDTSTYMLGSVAVGIILPESNGNNENWTTDEKNQVVAEIQDGLEWWKNRGVALANLSFQYDLQLGIPTTYEPIERPSSDEGLWINQVMSQLDYNDGNYFDKVYAYVNELRTHYKTDWAFAIFVVDSSMDNDGKFTDGYFAYAYLSGPFIVMTYDNASWGINNMNWVTAHETGHIFMAGDQYYQPVSGGCTSTTKRYGYLGVVNANCEYNNPGSVPSIMRDNTDALDNYARGQIGWRDSDSDGIPDPIDTNLTINLSPHSPNPTSETNLLYDGYVVDSPHPHAICSSGDACYDKDVTIQKIEKVEYRQDNGSWNFTVASDGSFDSDVEEFAFNSAFSSPGVHVIQVRSSNMVGNSSTTWNDTVMMNTPVGAPLGAGTYDDTHADWVYTGSWATASLSGPYNNTLHYSASINDFATIVFQGMQFNLIYTGYPNRGQVDVYVDNVKEGTIDQYSPSATWQKTWTSPVFTNGTHTLKLVHVTGVYSGIDAIQIIAPLSPGKYDDTVKNLSYNGNWATASLSGPYNSTLHYSTALDDYVTVAFEGTQFKLTYTGYFNRGQVDVYIDNINMGTIDQYSATAAWQKTWASPILSGGVHTLKLVHVTGAYIGIDAIEILRVIPLESGTYDDTDSAWTYAGNWITYSGSGPYNNTMHYSPTIGDYASLVFQGNQINITYAGYPNRGNLDVYIDDVKEGTINQYNPTLFWQKSTTGPSVTDGIHLLKLVHASGSYVDIDAIQIIGPPDTTPPAPIDDLQATTGTAPGSVDLVWTSVGDNGTIGVASSYQVRYYTSVITDDNWGLASEVNSGIPTPQVSGYQETMTIYGLTSGTYYFAVRAEDEVPNIGAVSTFTENSSAEAFFPPPPSNDDFNQAIDITNMPLPYTDTKEYFYAATTEAGDPQIVQCNSDEGTYSIWYTFIPDTDGILIANTYGTDLAYDTVLAVWTVDGSTFNHVACNDEAIEGDTDYLSEVVAYLNQNTTYYIEIVQFANPPQSSPSAVAQSPENPTDEVVLNVNFSPVALKDIGKHDDIDSDWVYSGNWITAVTSGPYNNTFHYSNTITDSVALAFEGTQFLQFILTHTGYPNRGNLDVYLDNVKLGSVNQYASSLIWQKTWKSPAIPDGVHTLRLVHATGGYVGIDAVELFPATLLGAGKYDDTNPNWGYNGNWAGAILSGPYNNTLHYSPIVDEYATLVFEGTQFILTYTGYSNRGQMDVYVDDVKVGTIDQYSSTPAWQQTWTSPVFTNSGHSLKLVHKTGSYVGIDAIQIFAPLTPGKYDDTHNNWSYNGNWAAATLSGPYNNTLHYSSTINDYATLEFEGSKVILTYTSYNNRGLMDVYIDNVKVGTIDQYSNNPKWQQTWSSANLTNGTHTVKFVHATGAYVGIDAIEIQ